MNRTLLWFRDDLRVQDHPGLTAACEHATSECGVVGVYVLDRASPGIRPLGGATKWWLHHALMSLRDELGVLGIPLVIRHGAPEKILPELAHACGANRVHWSRRYGGAERRLDSAIKSDLQDRGFVVESFSSSLLREPWKIQTTTGGCYKVFTPFWNALSTIDFHEPMLKPAPLADRDAVAASLAESGVTLGDPEDLDLLPSGPDWSGGLNGAWDASESGGHQRLQTFLAEDAEHYEPQVQLPAAEASSRISPYLRFGQLSPHQVWAASQMIENDASRRKFRSELGWREFCQHLLYHFPDMPNTNLRAEFDHYPWRTRAEDPETFRAWATGRTGFPIVDAGMRQLWETGHMHNRVRMVVASLLVKNLGIDWREGEAWFWDTLVDADAASNTANWQWVAGTGADAAPYFRIFSPVRQQERFDPHRGYVKKWIPELDSPDYPSPLVDLKQSRQEALAHYHSLRNG